MKRTIVMMALAATVLWLSFIHAPAQAQGQEKFKGRLASVPVDAKTRPDVGGVGTMTAVLAGSKLTINGTFEAFVSPAREGLLMQSRVTGIRGSRVGDLTITKTTKGTLSGTFDLTPQQVEGVRKGLLYVQISSDKAPDGNVWGWLLK